MDDFRTKKQKKALLYSWPVLAALGIVVLITLYSLIRIVGKSIETSKNRRVADAALVELKAKEAKLQSDIDDLQTDQGTEAAIRQKFGAVKEGEHLVVIVNDKAETPDPNAPKQSGGFWAFLKRLFARNKN